MRETKIERSATLPWARSCHRVCARGAQVRRARAARGGAAGPTQWLPGVHRAPSARPAPDFGGHAMLSSLGSGPT